MKTRRFWHFSKLEKAVLAITITAILLVSALGLLMNANQQQSIVVEPQNYDPTATPSPTPEDSSSPSPNPTTTVTPTSPPAPKPYIPVTYGPQAPAKGPIESDPSMTNATWLTIAQDAWSYYQPGHGIDPQTGLPASSIGWNYFTDWDLGVYIQAVIDAQKIGLISTEGDWGSHARLEKVVSWLETRPLVKGTTSYPYWFYNSDGTGYSNGSSIDVTDSGTLLAALGNLKAFDSSLASKVDNIVLYGQQNNRTDYASLVPGLMKLASSTNIYDYYLLKGYASFWPSLGSIADQILNNIHNAGTVTAYTATLPKASLSCEPLLYAVFNFNNSANANLAWLMNATYSAHEAMYNATGQFVAYSEGISSEGFIWEWVVLPDGRTWNITLSDGSSPNINPVIYNKVAISFLALYNTTFAYNMSVYLEKLSPDPSGGYCAGADYNSNINLATVYPSVDSNTNGLILAAATYAIQNDT